MIVDGSGLVLGRMASQVAKKLLRGESVTIVNAEKVVITGSRQAVLQRWKTRYTLRAKGNPRKGPKMPKTPDRLVRRAVQHMLPSDRERGRESMRRLMVRIGFPKEVEKDPTTTLPKAQSRENAKTVPVGDLSTWLGAKWK